MNRFKVTIKSIDNIENLNVVTFNFAHYQLTMMSLDLAEGLRVGSEVILTAKPTNIAIAKEFSGEISYSNQIPTKIVSVNNGELLSSIKLSVEGGSFESIITKNSSRRMDLKESDEVTMIIKANELSIKEILRC